MKDGADLIPRQTSRRRSLQVFALAAAGCGAAAAFFLFAGLPERSLRFSDGSTFMIGQVRIGRNPGREENPLSAAFKHVYESIAWRVGWLPRPVDRPFGGMRLEEDHLLIETRLTGFDLEVLSKLSLALVAADGSAYAYPAFFPQGDQWNNQPGRRSVRKLVFPFSTWPAHGEEVVLRLARMVSAHGETRVFEAGDLPLKLPRHAWPAPALKAETLPLKRSLGNGGEIVLSRFAVAERFADSLVPLHKWSNRTVRSPRLVFNFLAEGRPDENFGMFFQGIDPKRILTPEPSFGIPARFSSKPGPEQIIELDDCPFWRGSPAGFVKILAARFPVEGPAVCRIEDLPVLDETHPAMSSDGLVAERVEPFRVIELPGGSAHVLGVVSRGLRVSLSIGVAFKHHINRSVLIRLDAPRFPFASRLLMREAMSAAPLWEGEQSDFWHVPSRSQKHGYLINAIPSSAPEGAAGMISIARAFEVEFHPEIKRAPDDQFDREFEPAGNRVKWRQRQISERVTEFVHEQPKPARP